MKSFVAHGLGSVDVSGVVLHGVDDSVENNVFGTVLGAVVKEPVLNAVVVTYGVVDTNVVVHVSVLPSVVSVTGETVVVRSVSLSVNVCVVEYRVVSTDDVLIVDVMSTVVTSISGVVVHVVSSGSVVVVVIVVLVVEVVVVVDVVVVVVVVDVVVMVVVLTAIQVSFFSFNFPSLHFTSVIDESLKSYLIKKLISS